MRNRKFGVEIEFTSNGLRDVGIAEELVSAGFGHWAGRRIEQWDGYARRNYVYYENIGHDGSELEIRSPILQGEKGFKELRGVVGLLNGLGCYTTGSDGLHVHHDAPEFVDNKELVTKLLKSWADNQSNIEKFIEPSRVLRSHSYSPCPRINDNQVERFEHSNGNLNTDIRDILPRGNLNCRSLFEHGTVEFRYFEGTLNIEHIESWIRFGQSFLNSVVARKRPIKKADNPVILMNRLRTNKNAKVFLVSKAMSHGHSILDLGVANA
jgi:hypothetical protein